MQRNATQRNATQRNATQRNATQCNAIQYNTNLFKHGKIVKYKKTKTDLQDCRVGVTIDIDKDNNHL